jgi:hypothetical protein
VAVRNHGAFAFLPKPFSRVEFMEALHNKLHPEERHAVF